MVGAANAYCPFAIPCRWTAIPCRKTAIPSFWTAILHRSITILPCWTAIPCRKTAIPPNGIGMSCAWTNVFPMAADRSGSAKTTNTPAKSRAGADASSVCARRNVSRWTTKPFDARRATVRAHPCAVVPLQYRPALRVAPARKDFTMPTVPKAKTEAIQWFAQRVQDWTANAASIGLSDELASRVETLTQIADAKRRAALAAMSAAQNATLAADTALAELRTIGGKAIVTVRAFAEVQDDPNSVYARASVPAVVSHGAQPPEQPHEIEATIGTEGFVHLSWKARSRGGTAYFTVSRSVQPAPAQPGDPMPPPLPTEQLGVVGARTYLDTTIPPCTQSVVYTVTAHKNGYARVASIPVVIVLTPAPCAQPNAPIRIAS